MTTPADAEAWADAQVARHRRSGSGWPLDILGTGPRCVGSCKQGRALCVHPEACGVQKPVAQLAPAEELQAEPRRVKTPQDAGELAGTVVGFTVIVLAVIAGVSWLTSGSASAFFTWAGKTLAALF
mgnify:CR=1 FL=1